MKRTRSLANLGNQFEELETGTIEENIEDKNQDQVKIENLTTDEDDLISIMNKKKNQKKIEDTHKRQTFLIKNELIEELESLYRVYGYGFKTEFINLAIKHQINIVKSKMR